MEWPNLFPENFKGSVSIKQNGKYQNIQAEIVCGVILTFIAQSNDWEKQISIADILLTIVKDKWKVSFFFESGSDIDGISTELQTALNILEESGDIKIKKESVQVTATQELCETMKKYGEID